MKRHVGIWIILFDLYKTCNQVIPLKRNSSVKFLKNAVALTVRPSLYFDSKTDIAARDPEPIVANGSVSVEPCG